MNEMQYDAIKELVNQGVGRAANILNTMLNAHITLHVPELAIIQIKELETLVNAESDTLASVSLSFKGPLIGQAKLVFPTESASKLVSVFMNESMDSDDMDSIRVGTLTEVGNVVLNTLVGVLSNALDMHLVYAVPRFDEGNLSKLTADTKALDNKIMYAKTRFTIRDLYIQGDFMLFFELGGFDSLLRHLDLYIETCLKP
ncbi:MAG: chemotaxis protein CheC [Spartobacteria bacterium]|nr:chemotaxis protein CheC [Spartobacteria bacterium]